MCPYLVESGLVNQWPYRDAFVQAVAHPEAFYRVGEFFGKLVEYGILYVKSVDGHAGLPRVAEFGRDGAFDRGIQVRIVEYNEGRIAAQLQGDPFDGLRRLGH